jgi:dTDP-glucose 4,6-dehydratase
LTPEIILVTGGAGFIGSNFIHYLFRTRKGITVVNLDKLTYAGNLRNLEDLEAEEAYQFVRGDICDPGIVDRVIREYQPDCLVNFAAETHVDRSILDPDGFVMTNIAGVQNLLRAAQEHGVSKFIQVSTDEVYGSLGPTGFFMEESPLNPRSPYAASKAAGDLLALASYHTHGLPVVVTRSSNNYGPCQHPEKLIPLTILQCLRHQPVPVYGDGLQVRDWLHVQDHCAALDLVMRTGKPGTVYNIGASCEKPNLDVVRSIIHIIRDVFRDLNINDDLIQHVADRKGHDRRYAIDPARIRRELGWAPSISFEEGLEQTVLWYLDHRDWLHSAVSDDYRSTFRNIYGRPYES